LTFLSIDDILAKLSQKAAASQTRNSSPDQLCTGISAGVEKRSRAGSHEMKNSQKSP
jgi:hypothetical protein